MTCRAKMDVDLRVDDLSEDEKTDLLLALFKLLELKIIDHGNTYLIRCKNDQCEIIKS